ncbi:glycoside hydrolase family 31 [Moniliophthora roreri]|nr:glycoside hydrolase family 31 [Moniliophthora roreri]
MWWAVVVAALLSFRVNADYFEPNSTGIKIQNGFERVLIQPFGNHGFRVRTSIMRDPTGNEWSTLLDPPLEGPGGGQGLRHDIIIPYRGSGTIRNGDLIAQVTNGTISFLRAETNGSTTHLTSEYRDVKSLPPRYYIQQFLASSFAAEFSFSSDPDEQFYGAGQQACCDDNSVNKKGQVIDLINYNSHVTLPVYMSNKGYLQFFNLPSQGRVEFSPLRTRTTASPGDYDALQQQFTAVTGRQPTPPDFMLGYQQSKLRYYNQTQVIDIAQRFHDEQVNVSLIVVDFFAWKFQGDWSFDPEFWPDPEGMARQVKELTGAEMMVSVWPSVEDLSVNYNALQQKGLLATTRDGTGVHDSSTGVYIRLWRRLNESYFSKGIHNFWIDQADGGVLGEPVENIGDGDVSNIPYARAFTQYYTGTQEATGKMYPWFQQQAIDEGFQNLTGLENLPTSFGVSAAASGISSWTLDIGGFVGLNVESEPDRELFVRWFAMGTFLPYMRVHGDRDCSIPTPRTPSNANACPNEPWAYGEDNFVILKKVRDTLSPQPKLAQSFIQYIALRYQLVPYVKRLFEQLQATGKVIMRPLYYDFSLSDPFVVNGTKANDPSIVHQYMFGQRLLVAPVGEIGAMMKDVYLPLIPENLTGDTWRHWWTDEEFGPGGNTINVNATLDSIPVFYLGSKEDILSGSVASTPAYERSDSGIIRGIFPFLGIIICTVIFAFPSTQSTLGVFY